MPKFCIIIDKKFIQIIQFYIKRSLFYFQMNLLLTVQIHSVIINKNESKTDLSNEIIKSYIITLYHWLQNNNFL